MTACAAEWPPSVRGLPPASQVCEGPSSTDLQLLCMWEANFRVYGTHSLVGWISEHA